jgi:hypothetical protein
MSIRFFSIALLSLAGLASAPRSAHAAQSYDNCTGFIETLPATISTQGVWCLHHDLATSIASGNAIEIATNNVTIDCNDFIIDGQAAGNHAFTSGVHAATRQNAGVRRCKIRGFYYGINLTGSSGGGHLVEDNLLEDSLYTGIYVGGTHNRVRRNAVFDTGGYFSGTFSYGIQAGGADVVDNVVEGVSTIGTSVQVIGIGGASPGMQTRDNRIGGLVLNGGGKAYGIFTGANQTIVGNRITAAAANTSGEGIHGATLLNGTSANLTYCRGNTVSQFATAMANCLDDGGNGLH